MKTLHRGITLIELMTVMVVIAILASVAVPSYRNYLLRSQRSDGTTMLMRVQASQEKFFLQNMQYTANLAAAPPAGLGLSTTSEAGRYDIVVVTGPGNMSYTATATPRAGGGQTDDTKCTSLRVNEAGRKTATGGAAVPDVECWR